MPTPLPPNPFSGSAFCVAYERCLALEAAAPDLRALHHCPPPIVCARILGYLLHLAPAGNGQGQVQREIISAVDNVQLMELAGHYLSRFICTFKRSSGPTPEPSEHPSRSSFEDACQYAKALTVGEGTLDHRSARSAAMRCDSKCCMLTGGKNYPDGGLVWVEAAHIIPEATNTYIGEERICGVSLLFVQQYRPATIWATLSMFTDVNILDALSGRLIHRLENIMTLECNCHKAFDELALWLKPVEERMKVPDIVTFSTETEFPLPCPVFLALHALCCEVACMSGAAEYLMDIERRMDRTRVLEKDGSTADLLSRTLALVQTY
ncbi:hypothetical protein EDC04DRAFT_2557553 [Pisolithus marmoratus]|nr:hypothetical protein EDC04DRAFT_2557553 [Pisolithus marmoratus]